MKTPEQRFWSHVVKSDSCWLWVGSRGKGGYGCTRWNGHQNARAHRVSWMIENGPIPDGLFVCHKCDVKLCVNPAHLFVGTQKDNCQDCKSKGRNTRGTMVGRSRLTAEKVLQIRSKYIPYRYSQYKLAREYGVSRITIQNVVERRFWNHV